MDYNMDTNDDILGSFIDNEAADVVKLFKEKGLFLTTAESCTGGMISAAVTSVSGASEIFGMGFVTYADAAKEKLIGVSRASLEEHGAVSETVAREMAEGALRVSCADVAVSVTGFAGPDGGTESKPVGTVFIAAATKDNVSVTRFRFSGNRSDVRKSTVSNALAMALRAAEKLESKGNDI